LFHGGLQPGELYLSDVNINKGLTAQLNLQATGAMAKRYHIGSHLAWLEVGGKFRNRTKFDNTFRWTMHLMLGADDAVPSRFSNSDYYSGAYNWGRTRRFRTFLRS